RTRRPHTRASLAACTVMSADHGGSRPTRRLAANCALLSARRSSALRSRRAASITGVAADLGHRALSEPSAQTQEQPRVVSDTEWPAHLQLAGAVGVEHARV